MSPQTGGQIVDLRSEPSRRALNGKYRRNGKLQSCEPCRKSKLRCDHKREVVERAPLTPATTINEENSPILLPTIESPGPISPDPLEYRTLRVSKLSYQDVSPQAPTKLSRAASAPPLHTHKYDGEPGRVNPGFFGATNFMCIFSENLSKLGVVSTELEGPELPRPTISNDQIVRGSQIISFLKDSSFVHDFVSRSFDIGDGVNNICIEPVMKQWLLKLWAHHGDTLKKGSPEKLRRLSELLWRNTLTSIFVKEGMDYKAWALQATGMNIRWEVIGLIAALIGQCATTLSRSDLLLAQHNVSKPMLARKMSEIASTCLGFCHDCEALDDLFVWLLIENCVLTASLKGDGSFALYREGGEFINAVVAMGLHIDVKQGKPCIPFFLEQLRARIVVGAYSSEVSIASYLGRPPRLSYRYCNLSPPLDITEIQLVAGEEDITRRVPSFDENGYNTSGRVSRATFMKAWLGFAPTREEVLDLALGRYSREEILHRAEMIQKKNNEYWESLPLFLRSITDESHGYDEDRSQKKRPLETLLKMSLRQGYRANELLLQRVLIRKTGASWDKLVEVASSIFQDTLQISKRQDLASVLQSNIAALLAVQGLRSAAVIAVELLKQEQLPNYPKNPHLPRSRTIQDLSVFAARLGDVDTSDGSFTVCDQGRKVITRILDKILSPPNLSERPVVSHTLPEQLHDAQVNEGMGMSAFQNETAIHQEWPVFDPLEFQMGEANWGIEVPFLGPDSDFVQWLESVDWERPI
ncbi:hypothetical protein NUW58_g5552 [Xylaria curta]|uniref:Uncharacterized protein n=1 Tax=Xylaria curta TaxID=42375 RepID=A0ACC1P3I3_9PEZI|nr:hypothetical protein NUW58_g5552 [Xylaria curta]